MIKPRIALYESGDLKQDSINRIQEVKCNIKRLDYFDTELEKSLLENNIIKTKNIIQNLFWEKVDEESFNLFLDLIKKNKLKSLLHNFKMGDSVFGFHELVELTLRGF